MPRKNICQWRRDDEMSDADARPPSKSAKKRYCLAQQALGKRIAKLSPQEIAQLDLPDALAEALDLYAKITDREGRRRQMQYIGRLMRSQDTEVLERAINRLAGK